MERINAMNETELLLRMRNGSHQAFRELYERYSGRIYGNILKLVKNKDAAQELLQEVFTKIWENRETITIKTSFSAYLFTVSKHMVYNFMRHLSVVRKAEADLSAAHEELYRHIEENLRYREIQEIIDRAIDALPPQRQRIYRMCKLDGKSYEEVSNALGISSSTVNDHIVKATRFVKQQLVNSGHLTPVFIAALLLLPVQG